jgi:hypothetical protein
MGSKVPPQGNELVLMCCAGSNTTSGGCKSCIAMTFQPQLHPPLDIRAGLVVQEQNTVHAAGPSSIMESS